MENIFEGAKFGDRFMTQANYEAIYIETIQRAHKYHRLIIKNGVGISDIECTEDGIAQHSPECNNIVSKYIEPIDENKLDELAREYYKQSFHYIDVDAGIDITYHKISAYKAGYRKAKEE